MLPRLFNFLMAFLLPLVLVEIDYQEEKRCSSCKLQSPFCCFTMSPHHPVSQMSTFFFSWVCRKVVNERQLNPFNWWVSFEICCQSYQSEYIKSYFKKFYGISNWKILCCPFESNVLFKIFTSKSTFFCNYLGSAQNLVSLCIDRNYWRVVFSLLVSFFFSSGFLFFILY